MSSNPPEGFNPPSDDQAETSFQVSDTGYSRYAVELSFSAQQLEQIRQLIRDEVRTIVYQTTTLVTDSLSSEISDESLRNDLQSLLLLVHRVIPFVTKEQTTFSFNFIQDSHQ